MKNRKTPSKSNQGNPQDYPQEQILQVVKHRLKRRGRNLSLILLTNTADMISNYVWMKPSQLTPYSYVRKKVTHDVLSRFRTWDLVTHLCKPRRSVSQSYRFFSRLGSYFVGCVYEPSFNFVFQQITRWRREKYHQWATKEIIKVVCKSRYCK